MVYLRTRYIYRGYPWGEYLSPKISNCLSANMGYSETVALVAPGDPDSPDLLESPGSPDSLDSNIYSHIW